MFIAVAKAAVGHHARRAAHHQPGDQDIAGRGRGGILAGCPSPERTRRTRFDGVALRVVGVAEFDQLVAILARGHVAQGEGGADHVAALARHRAHVLDHLIAQAAFEKRGGQGGDGDRFQKRRLRTTAGGWGIGVSFGLVAWVGSGVTQVARPATEAVCRRAAQSGCRRQVAPWHHASRPCRWRGGDKERHSAGR